MRKFTAADVELFHELWAGMLFDLIHAVDTKRPDWEDGDRAALTVMVIEELARRYGIIAEDARVAKLEAALRDVLPYVSSIELKVAIEIMLRGGECAAT
jgi:hypothetical protein